jgi:two-component system chemotaxis response regulator CheB
MKGIVVIGGSAGSLHVVFKILSSLKKDFPIPVVIVFHRHNSPDSSLETLLTSRSGLPVIEIDEKDAVRAGFVYLCPADYHVLFEADETFSLDVSEKVHYSRPSIDVAFRSAADVYGANTIGILLSGANIDGTEGLLYIQRKGGKTIVQEPADAEVSYMPAEALKIMTPTAVASSEDIGECLNALVDLMR